MSKWHKNPLPGPLGVCLGWALKHFRVETFLGVKRQLLCQFGRLTPDFVPVLELNARILELTWNASLGHQISGKVWTIIISGKARMSTFQRRWERTNWASVAPENPLRVQGAQNPTASAVLFSLWIRFLLRSLNFSQKNTWNYRKIHNS